MYRDEDNYFYITDRLKELIKYKGFQVWRVYDELIVIAPSCVMLKHLKHYS